MSMQVQKSKLLAAIFIVILGVAAISCKKSDNNGNSASYQQTVLVSDTAGYGAGRTDADLVNPWGISIGSTGDFWISDNGTGKTSVYDGTGAQVLPAVNVPLGASLNGSAPTGVVFNGGSNFVISTNSLPARFIYVTEDGTVTAWNAGTATIQVADRSSQHAIYKGVTIAIDGGASFIYAADFYNGKINVYDQSFNYVSGKIFTDPNLPSGYAPFNVVSIGSQLYVSYAKQAGPDNEDDEKGAGHGYIDIYKTDGTFVRRFASQGTLNSPWAITQVSSGFGLDAGTILVGNFGDGRINIFDASGNYKGQLSNNGTPITIEGLWALTFPTSTAGGLDVNTLYYTAGPADESHGVFGYIKKK